MKNECDINPSDRAMAHYWTREIEVLGGRLEAETDKFRRLALMMAIAEAHKTRLEYVKRIVGE